MRKTNKCVWALLFAVPAAMAQPRRDLTQVSLEELMNMEVTSVAKKEQKLSQAAAAVFVITSEDIRRSGATTIPEALRLAPGLHVAQIDTDDWAVSARGFNDQYSNKMLVLMDGRCVYNGLFSGVFWGLQDTMIEDVARIEVIRGPGAAVWGANAVNGVINVITKSAAETQGGLAAFSAGLEDHSRASFRWGGKAGRTGQFRMFGTGYSRRREESRLGPVARGGGSMERAGFRADFSPTGEDSLTLQGDMFRYRVGDTLQEATLQPPYQRSLDANIASSGGDILARWKRRYSSNSETSLQVYYYREQQGGGGYQITEDTVDVDFQHHLALGARNDLVWGAGYRHVRNRFVGGFSFSVQPERLSSQLGSAFLQDEIALIPSRLALIAGSKVERNDFTGMEVEPSVRMVWTPGRQDTVWGAVSRAVRTPSRVELGFRTVNAVFPGEGGLLNFVAALGRNPLAPETVLARELGYRRQVGKRLSLDLAAFHSSYRNLIGIEPGRPFFDSSQPPHVEIPLVLNNLSHGSTYGGEVAATLSAASRWRILSSYSLCWIHLQANPGHEGAALDSPGKYPRHQGQVRTYLDLPWRMELDTGITVVGALPAIQVPSYARVDARIARRFGESGEFAAGVQNALHRLHPEFFSSGPYYRNEIGRNAYLKLTWWF